MRYLVICPKDDERRDAWLGAQLGRPRKIETQFDTIWLSSHGIGIACLGSQNNTNSAAIAARLLHQFNPLAVFLVGTAMGRPGLETPSVVLARGAIKDLSETEVKAKGEYRPTDRPQFPAVTEIIQDLCAAVPFKRAVNRRLQSLARGQDDRLKDFPASLPILVEPLASGNIYFNKDGESQAVARYNRKRLWDRVGNCKVYDMEAAGISMICEARRLPLFVVRGISDHGEGSSFSDISRSQASISAGAVMREITRHIDSDTDVRRSLVHVKAGDLTRVHPRYDGEWRGGFAYISDDGDFVVLADRSVVLFQDVEGRVHGDGHSELVLGEFPRPESSYRVQVRINSDSSISGAWEAGDGDTRHRGAVFAKINEDDTEVTGLWLGSHKQGLRMGVFVWYNVERGGRLSGHPGYSDDDLVGHLRTILNKAQ